MEAGPDFRRAEILLEGAGLLRGDVEIHVSASDWRNHGHHEQAEYNDVVLHVVLWNDTVGKSVKTQSGKKIPQLVLSAYLDYELTELADVIDLSSYPENNESSDGQCHKLLLSSDVSDEWIGQFLNYAGDERILRKARRFEGALDTKTFEQILYEGIMESLGYKNNKRQFAELAARLPLKTIRERVPADSSGAEKRTRIQALLFGGAGLLPSQKDPAVAFDAETVQYVELLEAYWKEASGDLAERVMDSRVWRFGGGRPVNSPPRRMVGMSSVIADSMGTGLIRALLAAFERAEGQARRQRQAAAIVKELAGVFVGASDDYWDRRYTLGGKLMARPAKLIGKDRYAVMFINVVVPVLLVHARQDDDLEQERKLHAIFRAQRQLPESNVTRFMGRRLFGPGERAKTLIDSARRQQGLYQIYQDFCEKGSANCERCAFRLVLQMAPS